jgi:hypothetical protein
MFSLTHEKALRALVFLAASAITGAVIYYGTPAFTSLQDSLPGNGGRVGTVLALLCLAALSLALTAGVLLAALGLSRKLPRMPRGAFLGVSASLLFLTLLLPALHT